MDSRRKQLLERIAQARAQQPRRFGAELKRDIVAYAESRQADDIPISVIARELTLSATILGVWLRHAKRRRAAGRQPFEPVSPTQRLAVAIPPRTENAPTKTSGQTRPAAPNGSARGNPRRGARKGFWLVVRAEHVYMTSTMPEGLERLLDDSDKGADGSA